MRCSEYTRNIHALQLVRDCYSIDRYSYADDRRLRDGRSDARPRGTRQEAGEFSCVCLARGGRAAPECSRTDQLPRTGGVDWSVEEFGSSIHCLARAAQIGECSESHRDGHAGIQSPNAVEKKASAPPTPLPDAGRGFPAARSSTSVPAADTPTHSSCRKKSATEMKRSFRRDLSCVRWPGLRAYPAILEIQ